jgi:hypothetical protein
VVVTSVAAPSVGDTAVVTVTVADPGRVRPAGVSSHTFASAGVFGRYQHREQHTNSAGVADAEHSVAADTAGRSPADGRNRVETSSTASGQQRVAFVRASSGDLRSVSVAIVGGASAGSSLVGDQVLPDQWVGDATGGGSTSAFVEVTGAGVGFQVTGSCSVQPPPSHPERADDGTAWIALYRADFTMPVVEVRCDAAEATRSGSVNVRSVLPPGRYVFVVQGGAGAAVRSDGLTSAAGSVTAQGTLTFTP